MRYVANNVTVTFSEISENVHYTEIGTLKKTQNSYPILWSNII